MIDTKTRLAFEAQVAGFDAPGRQAADAVERSAACTKGGDLAQAERLCSAMARVAFVTPEATVLVYDAFARGWLGRNKLDSGVPIEQPRAADLPAEKAPLSARFWQSFWDIAEQAENLSAAEITSRIAALPGELPDSFGARAEVVARTHPGAAGAAERAVPARLSLDALAAQPAGSLGHALHRLIVDNRFDLEVLDREAIGLVRLPSALRYLNTRILQMHDIWHLVGGYATTSLHEIAISAFQLAQFGHNYSAMFLATVATSSRFNRPEALGLLLQVMAEAWEHGRTSPSFMAIEWEREWHRTIPEIHARHKIEPFASVFPADVIEQARAARA